MMGGERVKFAARKMTEAITNVVQDSGLTWDDVDLQRRIKRK